MQMVTTKNKVIALNKTLYLPELVIGEFMKLRTLFTIGVM